ncbi:MAG: hypothetical protein ACK40L_05935 [Hydrogenophaga sp.]
MNEDTRQGKTADQGLETLHENLKGRNANGTVGPLCPAAKRNDTKRNRSETTPAGSAGTMTVMFNPSFYPRKPS